MYLIFLLLCSNNKNTILNVTEHVTIFTEHKIYQNDGYYYTKLYIAFQPVSKHIQKMCQHLADLFMAEICIM